MRKKRKVLRTTISGRSKAARERRVALAFPVGIPVLERVVEGVLEYARGRGGWLVSRAPERLDLSVDWLRHWDGDGAIVVLANRRQASAARRMPMAVVNLGGYLEEPAVPTVAADDLAIGRMAAEHLLERRFSRFGYFGPRGVWYSARRLAGFRGRVAEIGANVDVLWAAGPFEAVRRWADERQELVGWLRGLQAPVGVMAGNDQRALMVLEACGRIGLRVPEDVAVVGVDNDLVACEFSRPALSSIDRDDRAHGRIAAETLEGLMAGRRAPKTLILVAPRGMVARASTDAMAIEDREVADAVRQAREQIGERFGVERMVETSGLSRRTFEVRFRRSLGCAPHEFLSRMRVERAMGLLRGRPKVPLTRIAADCGFGDARRLRVVFLRLTGVSAAGYRRGLPCSRATTGWMAAGPGLNIA